MASRLEVPKQLEVEEGREVTPRSSRKVLGLQSFFHHLDEAYEKKVESEKREKGGILDEETQQGLLGSEPMPLDLSSSSEDSDSDSDDAASPAPRKSSGSRNAAKLAGPIALEKLARASSADGSSSGAPSSPSGAKRSSDAASASQASANGVAHENSDSSLAGGKSGARIHLASQPRAQTLITPSTAVPSATQNSSTTSAQRASAVGSLKSFWENLNEKERNEAERLRVKPSDVGRSNRSASGLGFALPAYTRTDSTNKLFGAHNSPISPRGAVASSPRIYQASEHTSPSRTATETPKTSSALTKSAEGLTNSTQISSPRLNSPRASSAVLSVNSPRKVAVDTPSRIEENKATSEAPKTADIKEPVEAAQVEASSPAVATDANTTPSGSSKKSKPSRTSSKGIPDATENDTSTVAVSPPTAASNELTKKTKRSSRKRSASPRNFESDPTADVSVDPRKSSDGADDSLSQDTSTTVSSGGKHSKSASRKASSISADTKDGHSEVNGTDSEVQDRDIQSDIEGYHAETKDRKKKHSKGETTRANSTSHIASKERVRKSSAGASSAATASPDHKGSPSVSKRGEMPPIYLNAQSSPDLFSPTENFKKQHSKTEVVSSKYTKQHSKSDVHKADSPRDKKKKSKRGSSKSTKGDGTDHETSSTTSHASSTATSTAASPESSTKAGRKKKKTKKKYDDESNGNGAGVTPEDAAAVSTAVATSQALSASGNGQIELGKLKSFFSNWESKGMSHSWEINPQEIEFVELIGEGTSCAVYKGTYRGQEVALKVLKDINTKQLTNFVKEFDIVSVFRSPHVVFFFGACIEPVPVMVLGLCAKGSLYDVLKRPDSNLTWGNVVKVCISTLRGLDSLHKWKPQILHRDLKSRNILVEDDWTAKLCDFGESRYNTGTNVDTLCKIRGTYAYISPEVYFGQSFTPKSDVYAFGVILWELCNRCVRGVYQAPFSEYKALVYDFQIIVQASRKGMRPTIAPLVPPALANVVRLCWDHEPANRPTAAQLLKFFEEIAVDPSHPEDWEKAKHAPHWPPLGGPGVAGVAPTTKGD